MAPGHLQSEVVIVRVLASSPRRLWAMSVLCICSPGAKSNGLRALAAVNTDYLVHSCCPFRQLGRRRPVSGVCFGSPAGASVTRAVLTSPWRRLPVSAIRSERSVDPFGERDELWP